MGAIDDALAALESADAPANAPSRPATVAEVVAMALEHADVRATRSAR